MRQEDPLKERRIPAGGFIYREGEAGDAVFIIQSGEVEVLRQAGGGLVRLAVLRQGAIFGEMAVIRDRPRSTTVRALGLVTLLAIPKDTFLSAFQRDNPLALAILQTLCERLLQAESRLLQQRLYSVGARTDETKRVRLLAASPEVETQIGSEGMDVAALPFRVGRHALPDEPPSASKIELSLHAPGGVQLSPLHFALEAKDGRLQVRDLGSQLGTLVNGQRIAYFEASESADLRFGENLIQAGGLESPYHFRIIVERGETA